MRDAVWLLLGIAIGAGLLALGWWGGNVIASVDWDLLRQQLAKRF